MIFVKRRKMLSIDKNLEERRMRITQIYVCVLLYFLLKAATFDVPSYLSKWQ